MMSEYYSLALLGENYGLVFEQNPVQPKVDVLVYRLNGRQKQLLNAEETSAFWSIFRQQYPQESMDAFSASDLDPRITIINTMVHSGVATKEPLILP